MIFTNVKIFNMFGINETDIELTYARKTISSPVAQYLKKFNKINYKKINIIVGANASGKTSIGKSFCLIQNFLHGRTIDTEKTFLQNAHYKKTEKYGFDVEFIINDFIYNAYIEFDGSNLSVEKWKRVEISEYDSILTLRQKLSQAELLYTYSKPNEVEFEDENDFEEYIFELKSSFLSSTLYKAISGEIRNAQVFSYRYSREEFGHSVNNVDLEFFTSLMKAFDPSIKAVTKSQDNDKELIIELENGVKQRISEDGTLENYSVLSAGTREAIHIVEVLYSIRNNSKGIYFIDEQLAYSHSDLEKAIIELVLQWIDDKDIQVFFTTHNKEVLDIGLPPFNYMFTRKYNGSDSIEVIHPEFEVVHKNRSLKGVVNEDVFSISPSLDSLLEVIE